MFKFIYIIYLFFKRTICFYKLIWNFNTIFNNIHFKELCLLELYACLLDYLVLYDRL